VGLVVSASPDPIHRGSLAAFSYTALYTVILNLIVTIVLTPLLNSMHAAAVDETVAAEYRAQ